MTCREGPESTKSLRSSPLRIHQRADPGRQAPSGSTIAFIGVLAGPPLANSRLPLMVMQQQRLQGVTVGSVEDLQAMCGVIAQNVMKPMVDRTYPFDQAREAFAHMASGAHFGKVAIEMA